MSTQAVREVISRAVADEAFRRELFSNPGAALEDYDLSESERLMLSSLDEENFGEFAGDLGGRTTKGTWLPGA